MSGEIVEFLMKGPVFIIVILVVYFLSSIKVLREYERGVVFRLGRLLDKPKGPGLIFVFWPIDKIIKVDLRTVTMDVPSQDIITKDNVSCTVNAVAYFRVVDAQRAIVDVEHYMYATSQLAQTTLRSVLGQVELDELLSEREKLNIELQSILDRHTDPWGIKVSLVEMKQVDLPDEMRRALAKQAEAERLKRAKIIHADGEFQSAQKLAEAAEVLATQPNTIQLRYLQTLSDIGMNNSKTIVFPFPTELLQMVKPK
ncbi:MAG TPA: slipin family protein [Myxococcota bacterium]|nr:slipin family protein [Myxococcota bacterium]HOA14504.1 slipin family protein [Myxococcota bacterium]HOD00198.1 slipin family protein [Myxococcota bacterium]HOH77821.1 slipin family protein [Myxococcota bacterium]HPV04525.1 slipin family protein [Myxococcota bacterium]